MASASRKARNTFSGLVARTRCRRTVLPWDMTLPSPLLSGAYRMTWLDQLGLCHKDARRSRGPTTRRKKYTRRYSRVPVQLRRIEMLAGAEPDTRAQEFLRINRIAVDAGFIVKMRARGA